MNARKTSGIALAAAAAALFSTFAGAVHADEAKVKCVGVNACKGQSACKSARNSCKGQNAGKGQGFRELTKSACHAVKAQGEGEAR